MLDHVKRHFGLKDSQCKHCEKLYFTRSNLSVHMKTCKMLKSLGIKPKNDGLELAEMAVEIKL